MDRTSVSQDTESNNTTVRITASKAAIKQHGSPQTDTLIK